MTRALRLSGAYFSAFPESSVTSWQNPSSGASAAVKGRAWIIAPAIFAMAAGTDGLFVAGFVAEETGAAEPFGIHADLAAPFAAFIADVRASAQIRITEFAISHRQEA
jgi:hypothetical protein